MWEDSLCEACEREQASRGREERHQAVLAHRRAGAGIPAAYHDRGIKDLANWPGDLLLACHAWAAQGGGLYVSGPVGTGKTTAAAAAAWDALAFRRIQWVRAAQLGRWGLASFGSPEHEMAQRVASGSGALVIDDLGAEPPSDTVAMLIFDAIQARIDANAPLLITSNFPVDEVCERTEVYGQRLASRLFQYCHQVHVEGRDHRLGRKPPFPGREL